ncbi:aromatic-amino-acid decarboxylase [Fusarium mexicanum]|uniref:Aromatic-amino-acid decarboxylase n=1 Tax=Fusarium mexicanum TaxID=751941 RepID=A0A8H5IAS0_9HYPO|nr:aromatic-amino-acid decarboxylase [Fusarium mexicanum]
MSRPQILFLSCIGFAVALTAMLYGNIIKPSTVTSIFSKTMSTRPVVVVGSGLAGLSASYEALQRGAPSVHLLDRAPKPGGNSIKASSGINGAGTKYQRAAGVESDTLFYSDSVRSAGSRFHLTQPPVNREALITKLTTESAAAVNWLVDEISVDLSVVAPLGGHSVARTHRGAGKTPPGAAIIIALLNKLKENGKFSITNLAEVKALLKEGNTVKGVEYEFEGKKHSLEGSVLFATGGFAGDATGLLARYRPDLKGIPSTNEERPGSHDILTAVGAELLDMDSVQIHPTGFVDPAAPNSMLKFLAAEMLRGEGGILLSPEGSRFVNEMDTREHVSNAIMKLPTATDGDGVIKQWDITILLDPGASAAAANHIGFYEWKGLLKKVKVRDLKPAQIAAVDKYAQAVAEGTDDEFGRKQRGRWTLKTGKQNRDEDIYIGRVTPITHFTMGGVAIDEKARVLTKIEGKLVPIPGLFAAGEITGGIHGDNRLGGSSLLECVVYGRTAGAEVVGSGMYDGQEEHDNLVWDKNDETVEVAQQQMRLKTFCRKVEGFVQQKFGRPATLISPLMMGGLNVLCRVRVEDMSPDVMVRLPCPSLVQFPVEKTMYEAATASFLVKQTQLPVPGPLFFGKDSELGSFIIMKHWENSGSISGRLTRPNKDLSVPHVLDLNTPESILETIWTKVALCLLELSGLTFPRIGSLLHTGKDTYEVAGRPVTLNMTEMIRLANIPRCILPSQEKTYMTADEWYTTLAEMHIAQLIFQHNDLVTSINDYRNKYVARLVFRKLAILGRLSIFGFAQDTWSSQSSIIPSETLSPCPSNSDCFRLWGDDFRAGNILLNESDDIAALIDWEYTYAGPTQFFLDPPWWLLLQTAEMWSPDLEHWRQTYKSRLGIWLSAMEKAEANMGASAYDNFAVPLSRYMRESWQTGRFFLSYTARKSWAFDAMYWNFLDERFFGDRDPGVVKGDLWKTRIDLLSDDERAAMEPFVQRKMAEGKERRIVEWDETEAQKRFSELLFN